MHAGLFLVCLSFFILEIGLFHPPANVDVSSSVAAHARSRIVNIVCDMTNREKMKGLNVSGSAVEAAAPLVSSLDIQNLLAKWKFRCLVGFDGYFYILNCYYVHFSCVTHDSRCTSTLASNADSCSTNLLHHVLAFISFHVDGKHLALREPLSASAASALVVLKVALVFRGSAVFFFAFMTMTNPIIFANARATGATNNHSKGPKEGGEKYEQNKFK